ncbi:MAG TPA: hypothetical protein DIU15_09495 [Deltaproteobacteria bacterium]|nr:hypothetical protein [Deltaproteobacteria bacterium]
MRLLGRLILTGALAVLLMGAGPGSRAEVRAWKQVEVAAQGDNAARAMEQLQRFLTKFPESSHRLEALRLQGIAGMELGQWTLARESLESYLSAGGRTDLPDIQFRLAICLAREDRIDAAPAALRNVAVNDSSDERAATAARELVGLHSFHGAWRKVLQAQGLLLDRQLFDPAIDISYSKQAAEVFSDAALQSLSRGTDSPSVRGLAGYLLLDRTGQLVDSPETEGARRRYASNHPEHPLIALVPGGAGMAAIPEDTRPDVVGVLLPLSGRYAAPGELALRGISLAKASALARGWSDVELVPIDTAGDPEQATAGLRTLVEQHKVIAVLGPMLSSEGEAILSTADELGVPVLMMVQRPGLAQDTECVFNTWVTAEEQVDALVEHAVDRLGVTRFAIAYPAKAGSARLVERFWSRLESAGGLVAAIESYAPDATDFRETARRLKGSHYLALPPGEADLVLPFLEGRTKPQLDSTPPRLRTVTRSVAQPDVAAQDAAETLDKVADVSADAEGDSAPPKPTVWISPSTKEPISDEELVPGVDFQAVFVPDNYKRVSMLAPGLLFEEINLGGHLKEKDYPKVVLMGGAALNHPDLVARAGKYTEGTVIVDGFFLDSPSESVQAFKAAYTEAYGVDPSILEANSYDTALLVFQLLANEDIRSRRELRQRLRLTTPIESVTGARGLGIDGEMRHEMLTLTVEKGAIVQTWPPPAPVILEPTEAEDAKDTGETSATSSPTRDDTAPKPASAEAPAP